MISPCYFFRYSKSLEVVKKCGVMTGLSQGVGIGIVFALIYICTAVSLWWGSKLVREDDDYTPGRMIAVST